MKTKHIPVLVMLLAGLITIVLDIIQHIPLLRLVTDLVIALVVFFVIGTIAKVFLDKIFNPKEKEVTDEKENFSADEGDLVSEADSENESEEAAFYDEEDGDYDEDEDEEY